MQFKEETVPLSRINTHDDHYRITTHRSIEALGASIETVGLMHPPLLRGRSSGFGIVAGFRRIYACKMLGRSQIEAKILEPAIPELACVKLAVADNAFQRSLNLIEISRSVALLRSVITDEAELLKTALKLGLPANLSILKKTESLCRLPWPVQEGILAGSIPLATALSLAKLDVDDAVAFAEIFNTLKLSLNKQREILALVREITARDNITTLELLAQKEIKDLFAADTDDRGEKTRLLRQYLRRRRFPEITRAEAVFARQVKKLNLGSHVQLIPPKNFESSTYTLQLCFSDMADLKDRRDTVEKLIHNRDLATILEK